MKQSSASVKVGDRVKKGQEIGRLGNSGRCSAAGPAVCEMEPPDGYVIDHEVLVTGARNAAG
jgi:hypothetical protein